MLNKNFLARVVWHCHFPRCSTIYKPSDKNFYDSSFTHLIVNVVRVHTFAVPRFPICTACLWTRPPSCDCRQISRDLQFERSRGSRFEMETSAVCMRIVPSVPVLHGTLFWSIGAHFRRRNFYFSVGSRFSVSLQPAHEMRLSFLSIVPLLTAIDWRIMNVNDRARELDRRSLKVPARDDIAAQYKGVT